MLSGFVDMISKVVKLANAVNGELILRQNYDVSFDELCKIYKKRYGEDDIYKIIYNEPQIKKDLPQYFNTNNFGVFAARVEKNLYRYSQYGDDYETPLLEKSEDNDKKIRNFIVCLLEVFLYNDEHTNQVNKILENARIMSIKYEERKNDAIEKNIYRMIKQYSDRYTSPMFLDNNIDTDEEAITLKDIFVYPDYEIKSKQGLNDDCDIEGFISKFISGNLIKGRGTVRPDTLYILGYAGIGKSSLVSKMMYHYLRKDDIGIKLFDKKKVICIKLRDIDREWLNSANPLSFIYKYLGSDIKHYNNSDVLKNKIIIMDGFDELCIIDNISKTFIHNISRKLNNFNSILIVTSRPGYIDENNISDNDCIVELKFFDRIKRKEWFDNYLKINNKVNECVIQSICESSNDIFGVPLIIYMATAKGIDVSKYNNKWELFNQIFSDSIYERGYDDTHLTTELSGKIYRLISEIAFKMYEKHEFQIGKETIDDIIDIQFGEETVDLKDKLKKCYAINTYFKENSQNGMVEFCHNEIRDFFICECIVARLNERIDECDEQELMSAFQKWFSKRRLHPEVVEFLYDRLSQGECRKNKYYIAELHYHKIKNVYIFMIDNIFLPKYEAVYYKGESNNIFENIYNLFFAVYSLYHSMYMHIKQSEKISILSQKEEHLRFLIYIGNLYSDFPCIDLRKANLYGVNLRGINLNGFDLREADLSTAKFDEASLLSADLYKANLKIASFNRASLGGANLCQANLMGVYLLEADLCGADLCEADLRGAHLSKADLTGTDLTRADLRGAKLTNADLTNVDFYFVKMTKQTYNTCIFESAKNVDTIIIVDE